jgi:CO dehydrogenase/acetyl-CoA synthase epsilon subunit
MHDAVIPIQAKPFHDSQVLSGVRQFSHQNYRAAKKYFPSKSQQGRVGLYSMQTLPAPLYFARAVGR